MICSKESLVRNVTRNTTRKSRCICKYIVHGYSLQISTTKQRQIVGDGITQVAMQSTLGCFDSQEGEVVTT